MEKAPETRPGARFVIIPFSQIPDGEEKARMLVAHQRGLEQIEEGNTVPKEEIMERLQRYLTPKTAEE